MIEFRNVSYSLPEKKLYQHISFSLEEDAHYALIGTNGTGKSTLLDMMLHPTEYLYEGKILFNEMPANGRIGYVRQFVLPQEDMSQTVYDYISKPFRLLEDTITLLCDRMATEEDLEPVFEEYQKALDEKEALDVDHYDSNIKKQLKLARVSHLEQQTLSCLSGGEFKLIQMIRELLISPKIMLMDEPDVFLDFEHLNGLRDLIQAYQGTLLVVTHNRYLLNQCFDHILHLEGCELFEYEGSYPEYTFRQLSGKIELLENITKEEAEILRQQEIVNRLRSKATVMDNASLGRSVHARQTLLDRLKSRQTKVPFLGMDTPDLHFTFSKAAEEDTAVCFNHYELCYEEQLLEIEELMIRPTDKVAIVGENGTGKTSLLRDIFEQNKSSICVGDTVKMARFAQNIAEVLDAGQSMFEVLEAYGFETEENKKLYLQMYGFLEEDGSKRIQELSGGEKDLFQFALLGCEEANFLLLDEPTGHLDVYAQDAFEEAVRDYPGGVLMVSHDFYTVANCVDYVLYVEDRQIHRMSVRKFRKRMYQKYFEKDVLLLEDQKKEMELKIHRLLQKRDYQKAKEYLHPLEDILGQMGKH